MDIYSIKLSSQENKRTLSIVIELIVFKCFSHWNVDGEAFTLCSCYFMEKPLNTLFIIPRQEFTTCCDELITYYKRRTTILVNRSSRCLNKWWSYCDLNVNYPLINIPNWPIAVFVAMQSIRCPRRKAHWAKLRQKQDNGSKENWELIMQPPCGNSLLLRNERE